jgi:hypothetical protein
LYVRDGHEARVHQHPFSFFKSSLWNVHVNQAASDAMAGVSAASISGP